jgi:hypothetical protein
VVLDGEKEVNRGLLTAARDEGVIQSSLASVKKSSIHAFVDLTTASRNCLWKASSAHVSSGHGSPRDPPILSEKILTSDMEGHGRNEVALGSNLRLVSLQHVNFFRFLLATFFPFVSIFFVCLFVGASRTRM